jgi:glycosyltransferase involved in cell wall biosynthesis
MEAYTRVSEPELSFVMPCYNEQDIIGYTIPRFTAAFKNAGIRLELIAVDNGSRDRTGEMIREMAANDPAIVYHRVEINEGYGNGILTGIKLCRAPWIGMIPCDGQVDAEDVVALFDTIKTTNGNVLAKVRRRFRMDGLWRKVVSVTYNLMVRALWPRLGSIDVNGSPKILPRDVIMAMDLKSKNWFLDPEIVIKAHYMGLRVLEFNVFARMRGNGLSHVRVMTCWEFLRNLMIFRFSTEMPRWRRNLNSTPKTDKARIAA